MCVGLGRLTKTSSRLFILSLNFSNNNLSSQVSISWDQIRSDLYTTKNPFFKSQHTITHFLQPLTTLQNHTSKTLLFVVLGSKCPVQEIRGFNLSFLELCCLLGFGEGIVGFDSLVVAIDITFLWVTKTIMFKQSPSRNQRSKGFRVKHALQIGLLLAVCIWLLYQVKHSHDKKKAFEESNAKLLEKMDSAHDIIKFGRKDLHPRVEEAISENEGHNEGEEIEDEEEENKHEDEEEENKHEEEEGENKHEDVEDEEREESKPEENEDEGKVGGGDDEIDENDKERAEDVTGLEEGFVDEEDKGSDEKENEEKEGQVEDQNRDRNTQEAREEQYKGDDASSAVVRDTQGANTETEGGVGEKPNEEEHVDKLEPGELGSRNNTSSIEEVTSDQIDNLKTGNGSLDEGNPTLNATDWVVNGSGITLSPSENGSQPNSTTTVESTDQPQVNNNSTVENGGNPSSSMQTGTDLTQDQTLSMIPANVSESNPQTVILEQNENSNSSLSTTTENANTSKGETAEEQTLKSDTTAREVDSSDSSVKSENITGDQKDESETTAGTEEAEVNSSSSTTTNNEDLVETNSVDSNDTLIPEVREARTDLSTLPETVTEGTNSEDAVEK